VVVLYIVTNTICFYFFLKKRSVEILYIMLDIVGNTTDIIFAQRAIRKKPNAAKDAIVANWLAQSISK